MKRSILESNLDFVEYILQKKVKKYVEKRNLTAAVSFQTALTLIQAARNNDIEKLKLEDE